jgi:hypothetical protein
LSASTLIKEARASLGFTPTPQLKPHKAFSQFCCPPISLHFEGPLSPSTSVLTLASSNRNAWSPFRRYRDGSTIQPSHNHPTATVCNPSAHSTTFSTNVIIHPFPCTWPLYRPLGIVYYQCRDYFSAASQPLAHYPRSRGGAVAEARWWDVRG